ncbi:MAG: hypothetical protein GY732_19130, partial [Gammaproteobacteria bacterium]|nr:hypothetical protein [Gammaproteobacteria bacterium]
QQGIAGAGDNQFNSPAFIAVDTMDNVYIADQNNYRIQKLDSNGAMLEVWGWGVATGADTFEICTSGCQQGLDGVGDGQFHKFANMGVDALNNLHVPDYRADRFQKFDSNGNLVEIWGWGVDTGNYAFEICTSNCRVGQSGNSRGQFNSPKAVAIANSGSIYVADSNNYRIQKFSTIAPFTLDDQAVQSDTINQTITFSDLLVGSYDITEMLPANWNLDNASCTGASETATLTDETLSVTLNEGENVTCTFNNSLQTGSLTIIKQATPQDGTDFTFTSHNPGGR